MKDNFSIQSASYAAFRPSYPAELYNFLLPLITSKQTAWDCGTGNGQVAKVLSNYFTNVYASDISEQQINQAVKKSNIYYSINAAERTNFENNFFDLIVVAQAIHWFDFDAFYREVKRTLKPGGLLAVIGYGLLTINDEADKVIHQFYSETIGQYWDKERKYVDENYTTIPFPMNEIESPSFKIAFEWTLEELTGYLGTWSAVQHYLKAINSNPVDIVYPQLAGLFSSKQKIKGHFPVLLRAGFI
jgi:SAM-dependent methyltransferase